MYHVFMNHLSVVVLRTFDGKFFEPLTREDFSSYPEAISRLEEIYSSLDLPDGEEPAYYELLEDALEGLLSPSGFSGVAFLTAPTWTPGKDLSPGTFIEGGHVLPMMLYRDNFSSDGRGVVLVFSLFNEGKMTFPTFSSIELLYHLDKVFVTADPALFDISVSDKELEEGGALFFPITSREETEEDVDVYGVWPWEAHLLPTQVAHYVLRNIKEGENPGPVAILVTPEAIESNGGVERTSRKLLGSETMGVPVIISFGEFFFDDGEDEDEY
jgi:hypothetical protein